MPRLPRIDIPGLVYHLTNRGVKRLPLVLDDDDRSQFLRLLKLTQFEFPFRLHAYCLMTNHYHLLLETLGTTSLSRTMQYFNSLVAMAFNRKHRHSGHVFQGRFHSIPVQTDAYFIQVARYIHLNPVKAGIVERPEVYAWSDYGNLIRGEANPIVDPTFLLDYFGRDISQQRINYQRYVEEDLLKKELVTEKVLRRMRFWGKPPQQLAALSQQTV